MIRILVVTLAPVSLQILAAARSRALPRLRKVPAWAQTAGGRQRVPSRPAETPGQRRWSSNTSKAQQSVEVGRVGGVFAVRDSWDSSNARLGGSLRLTAAGWLPVPGSSIWKRSRHPFSFANVVDFRSKRRHQSGIDGNLDASSGKESVFVLPHSLPQRFDI